jgi:hypothetical protein
VATPAEQPPWGAPHPSTLAAEEESSPDLQALARRFNPAMVFPTADVWPVELRYAWADGADLMATAGGRTRVAVANAALERQPWADLPARDGAGRAIRYSIDAPGDDTLDGGVTHWRRRFAALTAHDRFPPTQYVHAFWWDRSRGLLAIQYWFYYPYNEWVNRHEGDWEHVNVVLQGPAYHPVGYQFFFHGYRIDSTDVVRVDEGDGGDHVVVFAGGRGRLLAWGGTQSGASYPLPAMYTAAGSSRFGPDEDARRPWRFFDARAFNLIMLPEPEHLDARAHPELSWLRLRFYVGQRHVTRNPPPIAWLGIDGPPLQPAARGDWDEREPHTVWPGVPLPATELRLPPRWRLVSAPAAFAALRQASP